jgi:ketosteroid isomerase-like protein
MATTNHSDPWTPSCECRAPVYAQPSGCDTVALMDEAQRLLRSVYDWFNARDMDALLAAMTPDVDWPNAWEGGRLHGREAVRGYWTRQWAAIDPSVEAVGIEALPDGRISVDVSQTVRDLDGRVMDERSVRHVYEMRDGLVARMDVL